MAAAIGRDIVSAQGFWDKPEKDQVTALSAVSPKFKASNPQVQRETLQALRKTVGGKGLSPAGKPPEPTPQREQPPQNGRAATNPAPSATPDSPAPPKPESDPSKLPENQPGIHLPSLDEFGRIAKGWATGGYGSIQQAVKPGIEKAAGWVAGEIPKLAGAPKEAQEFTSGIGQGLAEMGVDMTTPANIAMISAMVFGGELAEGGKLATGAPKVAKLLKAIPWAAKQGFRGAQGLDAFRQVGGFEEAYNKKDYREAGKAVARFISDAVLIKMAGKSGKKSVPLEDKMPPGGGEPPVSEHDTSQAKPQEGLDRARHHKIPQPEKYSKIEAEEERLREEAAKKSVAGEPAARPPEPTPSKSSTPPPEPTKASPPKAQTPVPTTEPPKAPPVEAQKPAITLPATPPSEPAQEPRRPVEPPKPANPEDKIAANNKRIAELEARLRAGEKPAPPPEPTPQTPARGKVEKQKAIGASTEARSLERSVSAEEAKKSRPVQPPVKSKTSGAPANPPPEKVATPEAPKANEGSGAPVPPEHAELHQVVGSIFAQATAGNLEGVKLTAKDATGKTLVALEFDADNPARNVTDMLSRFRGIKSIEVDPIGGKATGLKRWTKFLTGQEIKGPPLNMPARGAPAKPPGVNFKQPPEPSLEAKMPKVEPPNKTLDSASQEAHSQEVQTTTESPAKPSITPSLGKSGRDVYQGWKSLSEAGAPPRATIEGYVPGLGRFGWVSGKIQRLEYAKAHTGYISTTREATTQEIQEIHDAIDRGQFQVEQRTIRGALGVRDFADAGALEKVHHQSTGRPLPEFLETDEGKSWAKRTHYRPDGQPEPAPSGASPEAVEGPRIPLDEEGHAKMDLDGPIATKMREIDAEAQRLIDYSDKLKPRGGEVAVGKEGVHEGFTGWAIRTLLREVGHGKTVDEAQQIATDELLEANKKQNSRNPDYVTQRWERNGVDKIEHAAKRLRETLQTPEAPKTDKPPDAPQAQALARTTPAKGTPERNKLEEEYESSSKAWEGYYDKERQLRQDADNAKHGTKKKEAAVAKYNKYRDNQPQSNEALRKQSYRASLEDGAEQTENTVLQIASRFKISELAEEERRKTGVGSQDRKAYEAFNEDRAKALDEIKGELAGHAAAIASPVETGEIKFSDEEMKDIQERTVSEAAQSFMEHPLTADKATKTLDGRLHGSMVRAYRSKANEILDAEFEKYKGKSGIIAGGERILSEERRRIDNQYHPKDIDGTVSEGKAKIDRAIKEIEAQEKDAAEARVNRSKKARPLSELPSPRISDTDGAHKVWDGNLVSGAGGGLASDGHSVIDVSAITDKKRAASVAARGGQEKSVSEGVVRGQAWDKIVSQAKQALEEVGYFSGSDLGPGHPETVAYTLKNGDIVPLSAKRVKLIQSLTGATELRGSSPKHGVAFYRAEKPVAVLMPIGASPDIDIDVARKAAVTSGPPKVKPDELPEKTPEP